MIKRNVYIYSFMIFFFNVSCAPIAVKNDLNLIKQNKIDGFREMAIDYAKVNVESLLYKSKLECHYYDSQAQGCDTYEKYFFDTPEITTKIKKGIAYIMIVFSGNKNKTPFTVFKVNDRGYLYVVDGGVYVMDSNAAKKMFLEGF